MQDLYGKKYTNLPRDTKESMRKWRDMTHS